MHVRPQRGDAVQIATPLGVDQVGAFTARDDQRLLRRVLLHLREWMPETGMVELGQPPCVLADHAAPPSPSAERSVTSPASTRWSAPSAVRSSSAPVESRS